MRNNGPGSPGGSGHDSRWGGRIPWYLRSSSPAAVGDFDKWLRLLGQRLERLFLFNEAGVLNPAHFGACLESETLGQFAFSFSTPLAAQAAAYFDPAGLRQQAEQDADADSVEVEARNLERALRLHKHGGTPSTPPMKIEDSVMASARARGSRSQRVRQHWSTRLSQRISALENIFGTLLLYGQQPAGVAVLVEDVRRICAASGVALDICGSPPLIVPVDDRLLQESVTDPLLARLQQKWPERARELVMAYHDVIAGRSLDEVFSNAFKSVEEIARAITGNSAFDFSEADLKRSFSGMHPTIKATISKLRAHRGDAAAHGRKAPDRNEIRYLLFQLCNTALLLLDWDDGVAR